MSEPTRNQLKGFALSNCIEFFNDKISQEKLLAQLQAAKRLWGQAKN